MGGCRASFLFVRGGGGVLPDKEGREGEVKGGRGERDGG